MLQLFAWIYEDKFQKKPAEDYFIETASEAINAVCEFLKKKSSGPDHDRYELKADATMGEKVRYALLGIDAHFGVECPTWLPETRGPEKKTRESRHRAGQI